MRDPKLEFIGWEKSALELVGTKLLHMSALAPDAFRRATVVVPTAESGRRLKEWVAAAAGKPLLMPRVSLAGQLIRTTEERVASDLETLAAWVEVLSAVLPHEAWPELFPQAVPERHMQTWAMNTADRLMRLQLQMEQYEVTIPMLLKRLRGHEDMPEDFLERWCGVEEAEEERWMQLKDLFEKVDQKLEAWGRVPGWRARAESPELPSAGVVAPVIVACLPELSPQVQRYLRKREEACPGSVCIWVNAPQELREGFSALGCVKPEFWAERPLPETLSDDKITVAPSAQGMARAAVEAASRYKQEEVVLASCDAGFTPALVTEFARFGWQVHMPEGRSWQTTDLAALPGVLAAACCAEKVSRSTLEPLLRNVAAQRLAGGRHFDSYKFNLLLDKIMQRYLPESVAELLRLLHPDTYLPGQENDREVMSIRRLKSQSFYDAACWLRELITRFKSETYRALLTLEGRLRRIYLREALDGVARQMAAQVRHIAYFLKNHPLPQAQAWALLRHVLGAHEESLQESPRERTQLDALGWRELAYAEGKLMILTGLHEGCVPELLAIDPFLPDSLRQLLGMPCTQRREARDAFLLTALLQREETQVQVVVSRSAADGSGAPVAPSSLLYHCNELQLVSRVQYLFRDLPVEKREDKYEAWSLAPKDAEPPCEGMESVRQIAPHWHNRFSEPEHRFSPSEINAFLTCPLRFWMKQALGISPWEVYNPDKVEMEAAEYGTLLHHVLEDIGKHFRVKDDLLPAEDMYAFAEESLEAHCVRLYGERQLPAMIKRQMLRLRKSLRPFLEWHEKQLRSGWECVACEHQVENWELPLPDGSMARISMRADRIDYNPQTKEWLIIDYKTHARIPKDDHLERVPDKKAELFDELMGEAGFSLLMLAPEKGGDVLPYRWRDVQLPMYAYWLMQEKGCEQPPRVAYYNLPRAGRDEPDCHEMTLLDAEALESALAWAKSAILLMRAGRCLYSAETFQCRAFGTFSEDADLADPRSLFHTLTPL